LLKPGFGSRAHRHRGKPLPQKNDNEILAHEERARRVLDRPRPRGAGTHHAVERRAQLPGAQFHARRDEGRRRRAVLPLELSRAGHRRPRGGGVRRLRRPDPVRQEKRLLRPRLEEGQPALGERRRAGVAQDPPGVARGAAQPQGAGEDAHAAPGQPAVDHAGHGERVEVHRQAGLTNDSLLKALALQATPHTPIWLMRQAGRYLAEYNKTRAKAGSFLKLAKTPALAAEVTLQPLERFPLDAAIVFSDILTIPDAMGLGLAFAEGEGPRFERPLRGERQILGLAAPDPAQLEYVFEAIRESKRALAGRVPLIGFSGSPFTLACYMVEGAGSDDWRTLKAMRHARPDLLHRILEVNARAVTDYLNAQIQAGADVVMLFDTWGGTLAHDDYETFSLSYARKIFANVKGAPAILFTKGGNPWLGAMMQSGCA